MSLSPAIAALGTTLALTASWLVPAAGTTPSPSPTPTTSTVVTAAAQTPTPEASTPAGQSASPSEAATAPSPSATTTSPAPSPTDSTPATPTTVGTPALTPTVAATTPSASPSPLATARTQSLVVGGASDAQCPASIQMITRVNGVLKTMQMKAPTQSVSFTAAVGGSGAGGLTNLTYVDESGMLVGTANNRIYTYRMSTSGTLTALAPNGVGGTFAGVKQIVGQGRGFFYAIFDTGRVGIYQLNQTGTAFRYSGLIASTSGWNQFSAVASGNNGIFYGIRASTGELVQATKTSPFTTAAGFKVVTVGKGWGAFRDIESAGDGLLYGIRTDGKVGRYFQTDPAASSGFRGGLVDYLSGWNAFELFTLNPAACNPYVAKVRTAITNRSLTWNGTGSSFCSSHYCTPSYWCIDFAWAQWRDTGITPTAPWATSKVTSPIDYGNAYGTNKGRSVTSSQPGDIIVWGPVGAYVGHVGVVTRNYGNGRIDYMNGNYANKSLLMTNRDPVTAIPALGSYDAIVSPRL